MQILTTTKLTEIFVETDDFLLDLAQQTTAQGLSEPQWHSRFARSEVITTLVAYHHSGRKCFKYFYCQDVLKTYQSWLPDAPCYERFVALIPHVVLELYLLLKSRCQPALAENYVDSKPLKACHIKREAQHKVMVDWASKGKGTLGWFYGFKMHVVINREAQLVNFLLTAGNVADNNHQVLNYLFKEIEGKVYGDKGYLSVLKEELLDKGVDLMPKMRRNGKKDAIVHQKDAYYHRHRGLIESVFGQCVGLIDLEHTRHRAPLNCFCHMFAALLAYTFADQHPRIIAFEDRNRLLKAA
jgi:hypothetical protein